MFEEEGPCTLSNVIHILDFQYLSHVFLLCPRSRVRYRPKLPDS